MLSEAKVTEIYCLADNFYKEIAKYQENCMLSSSSTSGKHLNKKCMSVTEIIFIMIFSFRWISMLRTLLFYKPIIFKRFVESKIRSEVDSCEAQTVKIFFLTVLLRRGACVRIATESLITLRSNTEAFDLFN